MKGRAPGPVTLRGDVVHLEPLRESHEEDLVKAGRDESIWKWMPARLLDREAMHGFIAEANAQEAAGSRYAFAVRLVETGELVGSTSYLRVEPEHRKLEIGWTWYAPEWWGTDVNPAAKLLLLRHAFEDWAAIRVQFMMDSLNARSEAGVKKLGAVYEGKLRNDRIRPDGTIRHSLVYALTDEEWPAARDRLEARLAVTGGSVK